VIFFVLFYGKKGVAAMPAKRPPTLPGFTDALTFGFVGVAILALCVLLWLYVAVKDYGSATHWQYVKSYLVPVYGVPIWYIGAAWLLFFPLQWLVMWLGRKYIFATK
jgi:ABC-type Fe3+ transport system permease subunit